MIENLILSVYCIGLGVFGGIWWIFGEDRRWHELLTIIFWPIFGVIVSGEIMLESIRNRRYRASK